MKITEKELERIVNKAAKFIGTHQDYRVTECIEVAIDLGNWLRDELARVREQLEGETMPKLTKTQRQEFEDTINENEIALQEAKQLIEELRMAIREAAPVQWATETGAENLMKAYKWHIEAEKLL